MRAFRSGIMENRACGVCACFAVAPRVRAGRRAGRRDKAFSAALMAGRLAAARSRFSVVTHPTAPPPACPSPFLHPFGRAGWAAAVSRFSVRSG